ncbi:Short-chain dehydrogenase/reductase SDR [Macleaya cordata]|uniref:Short-chain dehydrogenase/reductase SDR n=1 Tax=Macleaya cordata TaxID=56857 RepID=A0A200R451_MACCD|nr:Short-chain dehydrogenase/reductase SDR [Macleaya cordata]
MDLLHNFMNIVAPPTSFITLLFFLPPYLFFKSILSILGSIFSEDLAGKVVLITGASSGIGEHLAYQYAKKGANLVLVARRVSRLQEVADTARDYGSPNVLVIQADVSKVDDCKRFVDEAVNHFGRLDHLVNNAGIASVCMFEDSPDITNFAPIMDTNFWGAVYPTYYAVPHLRQNKGKIVVMASAGGWLAVPRMSFYNASKAAVINFFEALRVEFGPDIKITIATPGYIESELTQGKFLSKEGQMEVDQEMRDVQIGPVPVLLAEKSAKGIVNSVRRGERYVTEPSWFKVTYLWKVFCPEVLEWWFRLLLLTEPGTSHREALNKKILDVTGAKNILYPASIQTPELKAD